MAKANLDPEKTQDIELAAMHEFAAHGYRDAKTDAIADRAGVSKGLVFHYFGSKANLYYQTVKMTFDRIMGLADTTVWSESANLTAMVVRATRYKIELQLKYPEEFTLAMAAYAELGNLPEHLRSQVKALWTTQLNTAVPDLIAPVIARMKLRPGVDAATVTRLILMLSNAIGERSKVMVQANPHLKIADFEPIIQEVMVEMDILEHGFLA